MILYEQLLAPKDGPIIKLEARVGARAEGGEREVNLKLRRNTPAMRLVLSLGAAVVVLIVTQFVLPGPGWGPRNADGDPLRRSGHRRDQRV